MMKRESPDHHEGLDDALTVDSTSSRTSLPGEDQEENQIQHAIKTAEEKKESLRHFIERFKTRKQEMETQIHSLEDCERLLHTIGDFKAKLDTLEKDSQSQIKKLKDENDELSKLTNLAEELCAINDPLTFLKKEEESNITGTYQDQSNIKPELLGPTGMISQKLHEDLLHFTDDLIGQLLKNLPKRMKTDITLNKYTAHCSIAITADLKIASATRKRKKGDNNKPGFTSRTVISSESFSSDNHYWEVKVTGEKQWECIIGVAKTEMTHSSCIGSNESSWGLHVSSTLSANHNGNKKQIPTDSPVRSFGIFLEYEAGRLSFYQLCDPITHLHTFTATFTEPLHAAFYMDKDCKIQII